MELIESQLTVEQIVNLSFKNALDCADAFRNETIHTEYLEWSGKAVRSRVDNLLSIFKEDKANFLILSDAVKDKIAIKLSFKNSEGSLVYFQSLSGGWWNSRVRQQIDRFLICFLNDKESFLKLFKDKI